MPLLNQATGGIEMANNIIKKTAAAKHVRLWKIADRLQMTDGMFSRRLRHELPEKDQELILSIIDDLAKENTEER